MREEVTVRRRNIEDENNIDDCNRDATAAAAAAVRERRRKHQWRQGKEADKTGEWVKMTRKPRAILEEAKPLEGGATHNFALCRNRWRPFRTARRCAACVLLSMSSRNQQHQLSSSCYHHRYHHQALSSYGGHSCGDADNCAYSASNSGHRVADFSDRSPGSGDSRDRRQCSYWPESHNSSHCPYPGERGAATVSPWHISQQCSDTVSVMERSVSSLYPTLYGPTSGRSTSRRYWSPFNRNTAGNMSPRYQRVHDLIGPPPPYTRFPLATFNSNSSKFILPANSDTPEPAGSASAVWHHSSTDAATATSERPTVSGGSRPTKRTISSMPTGTTIGKSQYFDRGTHAQPNCCLAAGLAPIHSTTDAPAPTTTGAGVVGDGDGDPSASGGAVAGKASAAATETAAAMSVAPAVDEERSFQSAVSARSVRTPSPDYNSSCNDSHSINDAHANCSTIITVTTTASDEAVAPASRTAIGRDKQQKRINSLLSSAAAVRRDDRNEIRGYGLSHTCAVADGKVQTGTDHSLYFRGDYTCSSSECIVTRQCGGESDLVNECDTNSARRIPRPRLLHPTNDNDGDDNAVSVAIVDDVVRSSSAPAISPTRSASTAAPIDGRIDREPATGCAFVSATVNPTANFSGILQRSISERSASSSSSSSFLVSTPLCSEDTSKHHILNHNRLSIPDHFDQRERFSVEGDSGGGDSSSGVNDNRRNNNNPPVAAAASAVALAGVVLPVAAAAAEHRSAVCANVPSPQKQSAPREHCRCSSIPRSIRECQHEKKSLELERHRHLSECFPVPYVSASITSTSTEIASSGLSLLSERKKVQKLSSDSAIVNPNQKQSACPSSNDGRKNRRGRLNIFGQFSPVDSCGVNEVVTERSHGGHSNAILCSHSITVADSSNNGSDCGDRRSSGKSVALPNCVRIVPLSGIVDHGADLKNYDVSSCSDSSTIATARGARQSGGRDVQANCGIGSARAVVDSDKSLVACGDGAAGLAAVASVGHPTTAPTVGIPSGATPKGSGGSFGGGVQNISNSTSNSSSLLGPRRPARSGGRRALLSLSLGSGGGGNQRRRRQQQQLQHQRSSESDDEEGGFVCVREIREVLSAPSSHHHQHLLQQQRNSDVRLSLQDFDDFRPDFHPQHSYNDETEEQRPEEDGNAFFEQPDVVLATSHGQLTVDGLQPGGFYEPQQRYTEHLNHERSRQAQPSSSSQQRLSRDRHTSERAVVPVMARLNASWSSVNRQCRRQHRRNARCDTQRLPSDAQGCLEGALPPYSSPRHRNATAAGPGCPAPGCPAPGPPCAPCPYPPGVSGVVAAPAGLACPRAGRYVEAVEIETPKHCCALLVNQTISIRWFILMIAFVGLCCSLVGTVLGTFRMGREHLTISLLMIGEYRYSNGYRSSKKNGSSLEWK